MIDPEKLFDLALHAAVSLVAVVAAMKRYINGGVKRIETKLDGHIEKMDGAVSGLDEKANDITAEVAGIKGYLGIGMPSRGNR